MSRSTTNDKKIVPPLLAAVAAASRSTSTSSPPKSKPPSTASPTPCAWPSWDASSNGPGEAREADLGASSGNGNGQIFVGGKVVAAVPENKIVDTLLEHALRLTEPADEQPTEASAP